MYTNHWAIREHNNGLQEVVTSIYFVKIKTIHFAKLDGFEPTLAGPSLVFSFML